VTKFAPWAKCPETLDTGPQSVIMQSQLNTLSRVVEGTAL
jgi:hypothetical protein